MPSVYASRGWSANIPIRAPILNYGEVAVGIRRLDDKGLKDVDFIKINVEEFELASLEGTRHLHL